MTHNTDSLHPQTQIKRFVAPTMRRALDLVRQDMGAEAVILSSRKVDGGIEVVTSLEPDLPTRGVDTRRSFGQNFDSEYDTAMSSDSAWRSQAGIEQAVASYADSYDSSRQPVPDRYETEKRASERSDNMLEKKLKVDDPQKLAREIELARERMLAAKRREKEGLTSAAEDKVYGASRAYESGHLNESLHSKESPHSLMPEHHRSHASAHAVNIEQEHKLQVMQSELADMRMLLEQQLWQASRDNTSGLSMPQQVNMPHNVSVVNEHLHQLGLPETLVQDLVSELNPSQRASESWRDCMAKLSRKIPVLEKDLVSQGGVFAFVGQTGVGKTTTIAKLAAKYVLDKGAGRVAIVTMDTYRVGAYDQLKSLGRILNVPVKAVDKDNSLLTVLASLKQFELILIDTAGFRHGDPILKKQLMELDTCFSVRRLLVLSCNSQLQTMKASMHAYASRRGIEGCVISKLDEASSLGEALSVVIAHNVPVAYTTDGQEIPKDITQATGHGLVAKSVSLMKGEANQDFSNGHNTVSH